MALEFKCKHCDEMIQSKFLKIGEIVECKKCEKKSTIPEDAKGISDADIHNEHTISDVFNEKSNKSKEENLKEVSVDYSNVVVKDIKMNFVSMVEFMVKLAFASIPAIIIICIIWFIINVVLIGFLAQFK